MAILKDQKGRKPEGDPDNIIAYHRITAAHVYYDEGQTNVRVHTWRDKAERASGVPPRNARDIALEGVFETRKKQYAALKGDLLFDGAEDDL